NQKTVQSPVVMALAPTYIVHMEDDNYVIGTTHIDTDSFYTSPTEARCEYLSEELYKYIKSDDVQFTTMGVRLKPYTRDYLPFIGYADKNTFIVNGMGSTGLTASPFVGLEVAKLINNQQTELDLNDYSYIEPQT